MSDSDRRNGPAHHGHAASNLTNLTTALTSHSAAAPNPDAAISAAMENSDAPVSNPTTTASTSDSAAAANPDATISAAESIPDAPISNPTTTASTSHSDAAANLEAPVSAAPVSFSPQHWPLPPPLTSHQQLPSNPTVFGAVVAGAPWWAMWSNEKASAFERVGATVVPRKKLAWGVQGSNPVTASTSNSKSAAAANPDAPISHPTTTASISNSAAVENPNAPVSDPTTTASTSDAPVSAAPVALSQQHWPLPPPLNSHQQLPFNPIAFEAVLAAAPWRAMRSNEKPSAVKRVDAAAAQRKKLAWGVQGSNGTEKSPGFRMRVDSDDGMSDDEQGSAVTPGPGYNRKRNQISWPSPMKKQKCEDPPKHTLLSLDKLMEFIATWREPCLRHPDDTDTILGSMINSYAHTLTLNQRKRMKFCFTQYPAIALLNVAARILGAPSLCPSLVPTIPVGMDAKPGRSNEGSNNPPDSSLSLSLSGAQY